MSCRNMIKNYLAWPKENLNMITESNNRNYTVLDCI